jgi:hypothetical protein
MAAIDIRFLCARRARVGKPYALKLVSLAAAGSLRVRVWNFVFNAANMSFTPGTFLKEFDWGKAVPKFTPKRKDVGLNTLAVMAWDPAAPAVFSYAILMVEVLP